MQTIYYTEFVVLAETRNYWEASERLYMNQSTLSKHIQMMETELGVPLFNRTTRHVELTEYGQKFLPYAREISQKIFESTNALHHMKERKTNLISLGTIPDMNTYGITNIIRQYKQKHPNHRFQIIEDDPVNLTRFLTEHKCDLIFTREAKFNFEHNSTNDNSIVRIPYLKEYMVAMLPLHHPLAQETSVTLKQLSNEKFCFLPEDTMMYNFTIAACQAANFIPNVIFTSYRLANLLEMVAHGDCVALLMNHHTLIPVDQITRLGYTSVKIMPELSAQLSLYYLKDCPMSVATKTFLRYCSNLFKKEFLPTPQI